MGSASVERNYNTLQMLSTSWSHMPTIGITILCNAGKRNSNDIFDDLLALERSNCWNFQPKSRDTEVEL